MCYQVTNDAGLHSDVSFFCFKHITCWRLVDQRTHSRAAIVMKINLNKINEIRSFGTESFLGAGLPGLYQAGGLVTKESGPHASGLRRVE